MSANTASERPDSRPVVDIVVPLYRNLAMSQRCVESVLAHTDMSAARLVLVNDASPEADLVAWCQTFAARNDALMLNNASNQGFVVSVNAGMALSESHDVVLLNSDTEVPPGWLERIRAAAYSDSDIATVTPFSNNGSICSYPLFCTSSGLPAGLDLAALDALFAEANQGRVVDLPTAVGFCMYIRRDALQRCGLFDAERYGRGYGEENDFSLRVAGQGLRNVLCADLFVYHEGGVSFGESRQSLMARADQLLVERYPDYPRLVSRFVAEDPLRVLRDAVDDRRLRIAGQGGELLQEWQASRDALLKQQQACESLLQNYASRCEDYERLLGELRRACATQEQTWEEKSQRYQALLQESRAEFARADQALSNTQQQLGDALQQFKELSQQHEQTQFKLNVAEHQLAHLNSLTVVRLRNWLKRMLSRS